MSGFKIQETGTETGLIKNQDFGVGDNNVE